MARGTSVDLGPANPELDPNRSKQWTIPPVLSESPALLDEQSFVLTQGIVYTIVNKGTSLVQNMSENEDDYIEFSYHGDRDGTWNVLNTHAALRATGDFFLLNRNHKQNAKVAVMALRKDTRWHNATK